MSKVIAITNRKGGVGKTMTAASLSIGLARFGKKVLIIDADSQHSLTISFGVTKPENLPVNLATVISDIINESDNDPAAGIIHHMEGVDILPSNNGLAGIEFMLSPLIGRETILRQYIDKVKSKYDYVLIDTAPALDLLAVNVLASADSVIIPAAPKYLDAKGLELLLKSIAQIRRAINPNLAISGILPTMVDVRTRLAAEIIGMIEQAYGGNIHIYKEYIPYSVRAAASSARGISIFAYDPRGKAAAAYEALAKTVISQEGSAGHE